MSHHHQLIPLGASRKRKEREAFYSVKSPQQPVHTSAASKPAEPAPSNRLLAGYMAHEFLTKGTLLGQRWDPVKAAALPEPSSVASSQKPKPGSVSGEHSSYADVSLLLKGEGAHIPGILNPTQLARWIKM